MRSCQADEVMQHWRYWHDFCKAPVCRSISKYSMLCLCTRSSPTSREQSGCAGLSWEEMCASNGEKLGDELGIQYFRLLKYKVQI